MDIYEAFFLTSFLPEWEPRWIIANSSLVNTLKDFQFNTLQIIKKKIIGIARVLRIQNIFPQREFFMFSIIVHTTISVKCNSKRYYGEKSATETLFNPVSISIFFQIQEKFCFMENILQKKRVTFSQRSAYQK